MQTLHLAVTCALVAGCAAQDVPLEIDPAEAGDVADGKADDPSALPDVRCDDPPAFGPSTPFRHRSSRVISALNFSRHRGIDLIASASDATQVLEGDLSYGVLDKALEDEDAEVFACRAHVWQRVGVARTNNEGHFALKLVGANRLPLGMRDLYVSVTGDGSGVRFLGLVAHDDDVLAVSDVDGTLTSSEASFGLTITLGVEVGIHDGAAAAFQTIVRHGFQPVYLTARSRVWTETTRSWLATKNMPRGPLRLAPHTVLPGAATIEYKSSTLAALGLPIGLGNGNRASDIAAYQSAGVPADRIFIKLPEYAGEVREALEAGEAVGFAHYDELRGIAEHLSSR